MRRPSVTGTCLEACGINGDVMFGPRRGDARKRPPAREALVQVGSGMVQNMAVYLAGSQRDVDRSPGGDGSGPGKLTFRPFRQS